MEKNKVSFLREIEIFSSLTDEELDQISSHVVFKKFKKNQIILHEEDTNEFMYIIIFGRVKVFQTSEDGKETILAIHYPREFFGEMTLIDGKTVPATVSALENSHIALISKKNFHAFVLSNNKILEKLLEILCSRLRESWQKIKIMNFNNAYQRIRMLFLMLSEDHGKRTEDGLTLHIQLTHQDIADMTGLVRETVTRVLDKWKRSREIKILKNRYIHLSPEFLNDKSNKVI